MEDKANYQQGDVSSRYGEEKETDYRSEYEKEHLRCADLAGRVADLEAKCDELTFKLNRIKENPLWKMSAPLRRCMHFIIRQKTRLKNCGSLRGVWAKIKYKDIERRARENYGTKSFPSEEEIRHRREHVFPRMVKISILVPLYNTPEEFLREMIESVLNQTYVNWELCLADGSDENHTYVEKVVREYEAKVNGSCAALPDAFKMTGSGSLIRYRKLKRNEGISGNTNKCLEMATGEYIGLFDHDDILHPNVLYEYVKVINEKEADYIYCDETTFKSGDINKMLTMHFKPDYAIDNLRANNYICHFSVFARELLDGTELFRSRFDGSQDHDMILRLTDRAKHVVHVPKLLYYWRSHPDSVASNIEAKPYAIESARGAVADHLRRHGFEHFQITSTRAFETIFKIRYQIIGSPKISILIANKDHVPDLKRCVTSILEKSTYENFEILVIENNSVESETFACYRELTENDKVKVVNYEGTFNYSSVNNFGAAEAAGEYLLLLNNDTQVITVNWMEEMLMYAQRKDVGAVGAKLYYGDKTIQHAGVVLGLGAHRTAGHSHYGQHRDNLGYMGRLCYAQNVSAVTGACLLVKKALFEEVGGLDESFVVSLNDVDFCLKLREKGYLNVFTPFAELYHFESMSRGLDDDGERAQRYNRESERFREKWKEVLAGGDPYYNPNFSLDRSDFALKI
ncbi:MAG: glycosyltransferase [Lachnospiraceae bacterium]|nr:glycosyltransferase [Lachnospiraceae bacterium]